MGVNGIDNGYELLFVGWGMDTTTLYSELQGQLYTLQCLTI